MAAQGNGAIVTAQRASARNHPQHRQTQRLLQFLRALEGIVQTLEQERQTHPTQQTQHQRQQCIQPQVWLIGRDRHLRIINDGDVVCAHASRHAYFLEALQQAVVKLTIGIDFPAQNIELNTAVLQVQHLFLGLLKAGPQQSLFGAGGFVGGRDRRADIVDFLIDQAIDLVNLTAQLHHRRVGWLIDAQVILVLRIQLGLGFLERLDRVALKDLAGPLSASRVHLPVDRLGGDPLLLGVTQGLIDARQSLIGNTLLVVGIDDAGFTGETHQLPLGILQFDLNLLQALLQKIARIGRGIETAFQV